MKTPQICEYSDTGYEQIADIWTQCFSGLRPIDSAEVLSRLNQHSPGFFLVAKKEDKIIGTIFAGYDGRQATIHRLAVLPEYQQKGIGQSLMSELLKRIEQLKPVEILTHASPDKHVIQIFEYFGFQQVDSIYMKKKVY